MLLCRAKVETEVELLRGHTTKRQIYAYDFIFYGGKYSFYQEASGGLFSKFVFAVGSVQVNEKNDLNLSLRENNNKCNLN